MSELVASDALCFAEARALTDQVKRDAAALWKTLLRLYEGGAHSALGYSSWAAYCAAEFDMAQSQSYRLLDAGRVLQAVADSPMGERTLNERQARELAPLLDEPEQLYAAWTDAATGGKPTAAKVREAVRWRAWEADWFHAVGMEPPEPADLIDALKLFGWVVDAAALVEEVHLSYLLEYEAPRLAVRTGRVAPPPPSYQRELAQEGAHGEANRMATWEVRVGRNIGKLLINLKRLGLYRNGSVSSDPSQVDVPSARAVFSEIYGVAETPDLTADEDVRCCALGYAFSVLGPRA